MHVYPMDDHQRKTYPGGIVRLISLEHVTAIVNFQKNNQDWHMGVSKNWGFSPKMDGL